VSQPQAPSEGATERLAQALVRVFRLVRRILGPSMRGKHGLSLSELLVVWAVAEKQPLRLIDLSRHVGIPASTLTGLVDRLELNGLVRRKPDREDRRVVLVEPGPALAEMGPDFAAFVQEAIQPAVAELSPDEVGEMAESLERLGEVLAGARPSTGPGGSETA
jgi:DNA-binding MarR family transcriptional regulator